MRTESPSPHPHKPPPFRLPPLLPLSRRLLAGGHTLILLALGLYALLLHRGVSSELLLYREHFAGSVSSALIFLWGSGLGLDLLKRQLSSS